MFICVDINLKNKQQNKRNKEIMIKNYKTVIMNSITVILVALGMSIITCNAANFEIGGVGSTTVSKTTSTFGLNAELSVPVEFISTNLDVGVRQGVNFVDSSVSAKTGINVDYTLFTIFLLSPYIGGQVAEQYGNVSLLTTVSPEIGVKLALVDNVYLDTRASYDWSIAGNHLSGEDTLHYFVGLGFSF